MKTHNLTLEVVSQRVLNKLQSDEALTDFEKDFLFGCIEYSVKNYKGKPGRTNNYIRDLKIAAQVKK